MQSPESGLWPVVLRHALAIFEFGVAGVILFAGYICMTEPRIGSDGVGTGIARVFGPPFILIAAGVAFTALTAWRGGRRWWAWQAAMPAWAVAVIVAASVWMFVSAD